MKHFLSQSLVLPALATVNLVSGNAIQFLPQTAQAVALPPHITARPDPPPLRRRDMELRQVTMTPSGIEAQPDFVGWYQTTTDQAQTCDPGQTWTSSGNYARCCATSSTCAQTILCSSQSFMLDAAGETWTCPTGFGCQTITVFDEYPRSGPRLNFICANEGWSAYTMYRHISTTDASSAPSTSERLLPLSSLGAAVDPTSNSNNNTNTTDDSSGSSLSGGAIGGIVAGAVIGIVLIAGLIGFLLWNRKKNNANAQPGQPGISEVPNSNYNNYAAPGASNYVVHEANNDYKPHQPPAAYPEYYQPNNQAPYNQGTVQEWRQGISISSPSEADSQPVHMYPPQELPAEYARK